jgi:hypothetical protein
VLNNREAATVFWLSVIGVGLLVMIVRDRSIRSSAIDVVRTFLSPKILAPFVGFYTYLCGAIWVAARVGAWETDLASETAIWFTVSGIVTIFSATKADDDPRFFVKSMREIFAGTILVEIFFELATFPLWIEIILQPIMALLVLVEMVARRDEENRSAAGCTSGLITTFGFVFAAATVYLVIKNWGQTDWVELARLAGMMIWLPLAALPYVYVLAWCMAYGVLMSMVRWKQDGIRARWNTRLAVAVGFNVHLYELGRARLHPAHELAVTIGFTASLRVVRDFRRDLSAEPVLDAAADET